MDIRATFVSIWCVDFEYHAPPGERPDPICMVAREIVSGRYVRVWRDELNRLSEPPYDVGPGSLCVSYYAPAELGCHLALGWPMPVNILDLYAEFRCVSNGLPTPYGRGLAGALRWFGEESVDVDTKGAMRDLAIRGGPWTSEEHAALLEYCASDVDATVRLFDVMLPKIDLPRALLRGKYGTAVAKQEWNGIPIDVEAKQTLDGNWETLQTRLIERLDATWHIFDGKHFREHLFAEFLKRHGIPWPRLESGRLSLSDDTFRDGAKQHPELIGPIRELRNLLGKMRLCDLTIGSDGRNRCMLSPFSSRTGRNQPSNAKFAFGPSAWLRSLIKPEPGTGLAYVDFSSQEFAIGAALSGDEQMQAAYLTGDPYMAFAVQAGLAPQGATKTTHKTIRDRCKTTVLATQYGQGPVSLAQRLGIPEIDARELLRLHRETYRKFWAWSDAVVDYAVLHRKLWTVYGWTLHVHGDVNPRSLRNFPMQANGAEMLRLACIFAAEAGLRIVAPIHDAILLEYRLDNADEDIAALRNCMARASRHVLSGFEVRTDVERIEYPQRYQDPRGVEMWKTAWELIGGHSDV